MAEKNYGGFCMLDLREELTRRKIAFTDKDDREAMLKKLRPKPKK